MKRQIKIGTRGSSLALAQTNQVADAIRRRFPDVETETVILRTQGDKILDKPLADFGGKGVFVAEFEEAVKEGRIDFAVHSAKDMPAELGDGLEIAGVMPRADARDVLVTVKETKRIEVIGTGSLRRQCQLRSLIPQAVCRGIRGNVPTRLQKLRNGEYDGLILAAAGLKRLGLLEEEDLLYRYFSFDEMVPAGGQGIIAIEGRKDDAVTDMIREISDKKTYYELMMERRILEILDAGCHKAVGTISQYEKEFSRIRLVWEEDGRILKADEKVRTEESEKSAGEMAEAFRQRMSAERQEA